MFCCFSAPTVSAGLSRITRAHRLQELLHLLHLLPASSPGPPEKPRHDLDHPGRGFQSRLAVDESQSGAPREHIYGLKGVLLWPSCADGEPVERAERGRRRRGRERGTGKRGGNGEGEGEGRDGGKTEGGVRVRSGGDARISDAGTGKLFHSTPRKHEGRLHSKRWREGGRVLIVDHTAASYKGFDGDRGRRGGKVGVFCSELSSIY